MKIGIIAALVLALVALYFVFATDMLAPATSNAALTSEELARPENPKARARSSAPDEGGESESDEEAAGTNTTRRGDDEALEEQVQGEPGTVAEVTRTPGAPTRYTRHDGVVVRDHRANPTEPDLHAYTVLPAGVSKVKPMTLVEVRKALRAPIKGCIAAHGTGAAKGGELQLLLLTSISSENLRVDKASSKISGLANEDDLRACVEQAVVGHQQTVSGAEDVNIHRMVFKYSL